MNKVGNQLREKRESINLSIDEVAEAIKIQKSYIEAIEKGDFSFFENQDFYQQVFVGSYADFLGLSKNEVLNSLNADSLSYVKDEKQEATFPETEIGSIAPEESHSAKVAEVIIPEEMESVSPEASIIKPEPSVVVPTQEDMIIPLHAEDTSVVEKEEVKGAGPAQMNPELVKRYLQDYDIKSLPDDPAELHVRLNNEINSQQQKVEAETPDIDQLIDEINKNVSVDLSEPLHEPIVKSEPLTSDADSLLNSSILDDIQRINEKVEETKQSTVQPVIETADQLQQTRPAVDDIMASTAVIDLTSGIEIETVSNNSPKVTAVSTPQEVVEKFATQTQAGLSSTKPLEKVRSKSDALNNSVNEAQEVISNPLDQFTNPFDEAKEVITNPLDAFTSPLDDVKDKITTPIDDVKDDITNQLDAFSSPVDNVKDKVDDAFDTFNPLNTAETAVTNKVDDIKDDAFDPFTSFMPKAAEKVVEHVGNNDGGTAPASVKAEESPFPSQAAPQPEAEMINQLDKTLTSDSDINLINENPEKTSMDLKIAKALGDTKLKVDAKDAKKIKRDRIIDYILGLIIIVLLGYLIFLGVTFNK